MSAISSIEWTDRTWNPVRGCSIVSPGCVNCYAMKMAHRFSGEGKPYDGLTKQTKAGPQWTGKIRLVDEALLEPLSWRKPSKVFVNSMSDLFHDGVPDEFIDKVFAVMALVPRHTFQILTKRPERMRDYLSVERDWLNDLHRYMGAASAESGTALEIPTGGSFPRFPAGFPLPNVWLGVSCEDQQRADERIPLVLQTPAAVRFISAEPLLGPIDLVRGGWLFLEPLRSPPGNTRGHDRGLDWVIVGGESGPGARPCDLVWIRSIVEQCASASVPCFTKQIGSRPLDAERRPLLRSVGGSWHFKDQPDDKKGGDPSEWPEGLAVRQFPLVGVPPHESA